MKPHQFSNRLDALIAEADQSRVSPVVICNGLQRHFSAVSNAARQAHQEQASRELADKILADQKSATEAAGTDKICLNPSRSSQ